MCVCHIIFIAWRLPCLILRICRMFLSASHSFIVSSCQTLEMSFSRLVYVSCASLSRWSEVHVLHTGMFLRMHEYLIFFPLKFSDATHSFCGSDEIWTNHAVQISCMKQRVIYSYPFIPCNVHLQSSIINMQPCAVWGNMAHHYWQSIRELFSEKYVIVISCGASICPTKWMLPE